ncbi:hypothetical protein UFO1_3362 [Pelosinus sp. UFO1]|nr:hypothetical protein UFO1_3362 [Pelosinus sp. UFO1]
MRIPDTLAEMTGEMCRCYSWFGVVFNHIVGQRTCLLVPHIEKEKQDARHYKCGIY